MNWENRFSTMVKESSVKIDEAKRRLQNIDTSRMHSLNNTSSYPVLNSAPTFQSTPQTGHALIHTPSNITGRDFPTDVDLFSSSGSTSLTLLHTLCEKVERQSQICDLLNTKVETLQTELRSQQKEMENFKERLSQICFKVESYEPVQDGQTLKEWKTEIKSELNKINEHLHRGTRDDDKSTASERNGSPIMENNELVASCLTEIKHRLDRIEVGLSNNHPNSEHSSEIVEKNMTLLTDWKNTNERSLTRLCKMQDLSVDEVKHLRSKLCSIEDKVRELETAVNDVTLHNDLSSGRPRSKISVDDDNILISENKEPTKLYNNSISSEEDKTSLTGSSVHLDVSDDNGDLSLEFDDLNLEERAIDQQISHNWASELTDSSLDSLSGSDNYSSSDI